MWKKKHDPYDDDYPWKENFEEEEKSPTAATWSPFANWLMRIFFPVFVVSVILFIVSIFTLTKWLYVFSFFTSIISFPIWFYAFLSFKDNTGATYFYDETL